jgi:septal ring factor EnvC (AmiA/AmiB activator)
MVSHFSKKLVIVAVLVVAGWAAAQGGPPAADSSQLTKEKLEAIQAEIESLRGQAARLSAQENSVIAVLSQYDVESRIQTKELQLLDLKQQKTQEEIEKLQGDLQSLKDDLEHQKKYLTGRLVEAYKLGGMNYLKLLLSVDSARDLVRSYRYISYLARDDHRRVQQYGVALNQMEQAQLQLEQEWRNLAALKQDSVEAHNALLRSRQEKLRLLGAIRDQKEMHMGALNDLRVAASQLQQFFSRATPSIQPNELSSAVSLAQFKGRLDWPVRGKIIRDFGVSKHPKFGTTTVNNGVEISASEGTPVRAVFDGEVVFSEWFKGYGQCIILSHPQGFYTLYGHNSELFAERGKRVQRGQWIASVGSTGALNGPSLYFEIRKKDEPLNPHEWLRKTSVAGSR